MAYVELTDLWIHLASDLSDNFPIREFAAAASPLSVPGEVRRYAGGRRRIVRQAGEVRTLTASFPANRDTVRALEAWVGEEIMVRDPGGRLFYGAYFAVEQSETDGGEWSDVSITVEQSTPTVAA